MTEPVTVKIVPDDVGPVIVRTLIAFGVTTITAVALIWIQRKASSPDFFVTAKMRGLNLAAQAADRQVAFWNDVSAKATKLYLESRP
jgi:hypothetical protein